MSKIETNRRDRRDGRYIQDGDPLHVFMPFLLGNRCDNEAFMNDVFDMTNVDAYIARKNSENPQYRYTYFHVILAAIAKMIYMRPKMNRYIAGHRYFDRKNISFSFVAKNKMSDNGSESLLIITADDNEEGICDQLHNKICAEVYKVKSGKATDGTTEQLNWLSIVPRPLLKLIVRLMFLTDYYDILPHMLFDVDPYRASVFVSNLGSINMEATYHHLVNWSTNSIFMILNRVKKTPFFNDDGSVEMKNAVTMGFTIDERIADGFYFARSIELFKEYLNNPNILDKPISYIEPKEQ